MAVSKYDILYAEEEKNAMREEYMRGASIRDIQKKYSINSKNWIQYKLLKGITRNSSQSSIAAHKKYPEKFKQSDESKEKIRIARLKYMKEHPENTAWRKKNEPSYPERCFIKFLEKNGYDKLYLIEREKSFFPYFIDFAFVQIKLAVEIDGSQHFLDEERKRRDEEKNVLLTSNGWKVIRISEDLVKNDWETLKQKLDEVIGIETPCFETVGIFKIPKHYVKVERGEDGLSEKMRQNILSQRKVKNRPSFEELESMQRTMTLEAIGRKFGVSSTAIRKWLKFYKKKNHG